MREKEGRVLSGLKRLHVRVVLLLCGVDKRTQKADIKRAKEFWSDYQERAGEE